MTAKDLIKVLESMNPDATVRFIVEDWQSRRMNIERLETYALIIEKVEMDGPFVSMKGDGC